MCSLTVLTAWLAAQPPLTTLGAGVSAAHLRLPLSYLLLAPYCNMLDTLTLLSIRQHVALLATLIVSYAAWRVRMRNVGTFPRRIAVTECARATVFLGAIALIYALGALEPRPMAALELPGANNLAVDFHSHTNASWDGRRGFTAEHNRAWHREAGFDVSYVSDHGTMAAAVAGMARNPRRAGAGTVILPAIEVRCAGQHVVILGATPRDTAADCDSIASPMANHALPASDGPVALLTIPGNLATSRQLPAVAALEVADGAPRALDQMERDARLLRHIADSAGLARISGSNNHGWGRTAAAWSILSIDGWRDMSPDSLDAAIRSDLTHTSRSAVTVIERRRAAPPQSALALAATAPVVAWTMLTALSPAERLSWICWVWAAWMLVAIRRASHERDGAGIVRLVRDRAA